MKDWTVEQWAQIKVLAQLMLAVLIVTVWLFIVIDRGTDFTLDDVLSMIMIIYFGSSGATNLGKLAAHRNGE